MLTVLTKNYPPPNNPKAVPLRRVRGHTPPRDILLNWLAEHDHNALQALEKPRIAQLCAALRSQRWTAEEERQYVRAAKRPRNFTAISERMGDREGRQSIVPHYYWRAGLTVDVRRHLGRGEYATSEATSGVEGAK